MGDFHVRIDSDLLAARAVTATDKLLFAYLDYRQWENDTCWPSIETIAAAVGVTRRTAISGLARLARAGLIVRTIHGGAGAGCVNHYSIIRSGLRTGHSEDSSPLPKSIKGEEVAPLSSGKGEEVAPIRVQDLHIKGEEVAPETKQGNRTGKQNQSTDASEIRFDRATGRFMGLNGELGIWQRTYPTIDVPAEIQRAAVWVIANPRKAKRNWERFLTNWLSREDKDARNGKRRNTSRPSFADQVSSVGERIEV